MHIIAINGKRNHEGEWGGVKGRFGREKREG